MTVNPPPGSSRTDTAPVVWQWLDHAPSHGRARPLDIHDPRPTGCAPYLREMWSLPGRSEHTPAAARAWVAGVCHRWRIPHLLVDDLLLIVSELATNAIRHAPGERVGLAVLLSDRAVWLVVVDHGPRGQHVQAHQADADDEHGRGLFLVETLASRYEAVRAGDGTAVWACLQLPPPRRSAADGATAEDSTTSPQPPEDGPDAPRSHT